MRIHFMFPAGPFIIIYLFVIIIVSTVIVLIGGYIVVGLIMVWQHLRADLAWYWYNIQMFYTY